MAVSKIKDTAIHRVTYTGTTGTTGVLGIPTSIFDPSTMDIADVVCTSAGYYAEGKGYYSGQLNVRIVRYDGQNLESGSTSVEVSYVRK